MKKESSFQKIVKSSTSLINVSNQKGTSVSSPQENQIVLGQKLKDPYTLEAMPNNVARLQLL